MDQVLPEPAELEEPAVTLYVTRKPFGAGKAAALAAAGEADVFPSSTDSVSLDSLAASVAEALGSDEVLRSAPGLQVTTIWPLATLILDRLT